MIHVSVERVVLTMDGGDLLTLGFCMKDSIEASVNAHYVNFPVDTFERSGEVKMKLELMRRCFEAYGNASQYEAYLKEWKDAINKANEKAGAPR